MVLDEQTELDINTLDPQAMVATLDQGEVYLDIRYVANGKGEWECRAQGVPPRYLPKACR